MIILLQQPCTVLAV